MLPLSWTLDHVGPMTRTVEDTALLLQVLAGFIRPIRRARGWRFRTTRLVSAAGVAGLIGAPLGYVESAPDLDPATLAAYRQALADFEQLGARVESVECRTSSTPRSSVGC